MAKMKHWLYTGDVSGTFGMIPTDIYEYPQVQALKPAARDFYIFLNIYRNTEEQRACLYNALTEYNRILNLGWNDQDITEQARPNKRTVYDNGYFVAPMKHLEARGYKKNYVTKLKKELIEAGFIKVVYGGKGRYGGWNENTTVYQFIGDWKKQ